MKKVNRMVMLPGVNNYDKLKNTKSFNKFNPFLDNTYSDKAKANVEASSLDSRYLEDEIYQMLMLQNGLGLNPRTGSRTSYYGLDAKNKRQQLLRYSVYDLMDEVLTKLTDEIVVVGENNSPIKLIINDGILDKAKLKDSYRKELTKFANSSFNNIKKLYGLDQQGSDTSLWYKTYLFLTEGSQAYELIWDNLDNPKKIIGIHEIDALDIEPFYNNGIQYWVHHKILSRKPERIIMYDMQVVKIDYTVSSPNNRMSYLEHLVKSFNDLRIIDESTIIWSVTNAAFRTVMKIPTSGLSRTAAMATVNREQSRWEDEMSYDSLTGEISINNQPRLQMMKNYYMGKGSSGDPEIDTIGGEGFDLSDTTRNEFFLSRFYKAAKVPQSRFDPNSSSSWNMDTRSQLREEIYFSRFVKRLQATLKMLVLKPLKLQLVARFPELRSDDILEAFDIKFNSYNVFEELMELDVLNEKVEAITRLNESFVMTTPNGTEMKKFALQFLLEKFLPEMSSEDYERNNRLLEKEQEELFKYEIKSLKLQAKYDPDYIEDEDEFDEVSDEEITTMEYEDDILGEVTSDEEISDIEKVSKEIEDSTDKHNEVDNLKKQEDNE